ncbi:MAG: efflux RND transporter periplasmic adaptor subunit [Verrucomicrobiales bacterium]
MTARRLRPSFKFFVLTAATQAALVLVSSCKKEDSQGKLAESPPTVLVAQPILREIVDWDEYTGRLASPESVTIRTRVSGYITEVHFKEGAEVEVGELLLTIDPRPYESIVARMEAQVSSARSRAELAELESKNAVGLRDSRAISAEEYERRIKSATEIKGILRAAEADLKAAQLDLEFTQIRSPIAGRVSDARITKGNLVEGGADSSILTTVVSLNPIYCNIEVDERSVLKYRKMHREGTRVSAQFGIVEAEMALANEPGYPHKGYIDFVDNELNATTGTIRARAVFPNEDKLMAPGFFARVRVPGSGKYQAKLVLDGAISDDQGRSFVWVIGAENKAEYRPVETGPLFEGLRVLRSGLGNKDRVAINGIMSLKNGMTVNVQEGKMEVPAVATSKSEA